MVCDVKQSLLFKKKKKSRKTITFSRAKRIKSGAYPPTGPRP